MSERLVLPSAIKIPVFVPSRRISMMPRDASCSSSSSASAACLHAAMPITNRWLVSSSSTASWIGWSMPSAPATRCSHTRRSPCSPFVTPALQRSSGQWRRRSNANGTAKSRERQTVCDPRSTSSSGKWSSLEGAGMRVVVAGLGVQGYKRRRIAGADLVTDVDPVNEEARYRSIVDVPLADYDAVLACVPDEPKIELLRYCLENGKHVLVEKPLWARHESDIARLEALARKNAVICYTAYNPRFEPHFVRMRELIASGELGAIYSCRMFYGNGTARLVRDSAWRDRGAGVLPDLGSHLLDTCRFWFGDIEDRFGFV